MWAVYTSAEFVLEAGPPLCVLFLKHILCKGTRPLWPRIEVAKWPKEHQKRNKELGGSRLTRATSVLIPIQIDTAVLQGAAPTPATGNPAVKAHH